jgi:uncharacterized membrane protein YkoI
MTKSAVACSILLAGLAATLTVPALAEGNEATEKPVPATQARISEAQARDIALARVKGGTVKSSELEEEQGKVVWSFDIEQPARPGVMEVLVDAKSGKIISVKHETPQQEADEARKDAQTSK